MLPGRERSPARAGCDLDTKLPHRAGLAPDLITLTRVMLILPPMQFCLIPPRALLLSPAT